MRFTGEFLRDTEKTLAEHGYDLYDIRKVVIQPDRYEEDLITIPLERFRELAMTDFDRGYGGQDIMTMWVFGDNFIMYREEYDGAEWWRFVPVGYAVEKEIYTIHLGHDPYDPESEEYQ